MYLKTLTLRGFKSFASATRFEFEPGVTCVVGPNGSGKSNVVDALAWVMGEQGAKTLRGGKMEDVIFAGTSGRAALGRAEVSLTIDNSDSALPIEYSEVTLTRTLFRNGGSEYAINGAACRLLDIQDLLSDSGLGREMHVIVGQGQLDAILRATPLERRGFIEEAAGVLKHRKRKEKALRKLDSMQGNLLRLSDLIEELRRQLGPLGRQAQAARKAAVIAAQVRDSGLRLLADDLNQQLNLRDDSARALAAMKTECAELEQHAQLLRTRLSTLDSAATGLLPKAQRMQDIVLTLTNQREQLRTIVQVSSERLRHLGTSPTSAGARGSQEVEQQLHRVNAALQECQNELASVRVRVTDAETERQRVHEEHAQLVRKRESERAAQAQHREQIAKVGAQVASQRARVEAVSQNVVRLAEQSDQARVRLAELVAQLDQVMERPHAKPGPDASELAPIARAVVGENEIDFRTDIKQLRAIEDQLSEQLEALNHELRAARASHMEAERQRATHLARIAAYEGSLEHELGAATQLVDQDPGLTHVASHMQVDAAFERPVLAALSLLRNAVVAYSWDQALVNAQAAADLGQQHAVIAFPFNGQELADSVWRDKLQSSDVVAVDVVQLADGNSALAHHLAHIVITDLDHGRTLTQEFPFLTAVTPEGLVLQAEWLVSGPREDQIFTLQRALENERVAAEELEKSVALSSEQIISDEKRVTTLQLEAKQIRSELTRAQDIERTHQAEQARARALVDASEKESHRLTAQHTDAVLREEVESEKLVGLITEYDQLVGAGDTSNDATPTGSHAQNAQLAHHGDQATAQPDARELESRIAHLTVTLERVREIETLARLDARTVQEQHRNLESRVAGLQRSLRAEQHAEEQAEKAAERRAREAKRIAGVHARARYIVELIDKSIVRATQERDNVQVLQDKHAGELTQLRQDVAVREDALRDLTTKMHSRELEVTTVTAAVTQLEARAVEDYGLSALDAVEQFGPHNDIPQYELPKARLAAGEEPAVPDMEATRSYDREYVEKIHERAVRALAGLGKVNPLALEEYSALEERHKFLSDQLTDLKRSRADLLGLVDDIDAKVQEVFAAAFADTAAQFARIFPRLFPGGEGKMYLTEPEDLLNTGIDIEARPAGKKVKRLSLLSGGERSLTAIAMLVSIFKARPSPFYVMDEVEAALDDVNLGRLLTVFRELQEDSQLIVITHQKRTMEIADALYGVSMQGDGISAVMSQRVTSYGSPLKAAAD